MYQSWFVEDIVDDLFVCIEMLVDSKLTEIMSRDQRSGVKDYLKSRNFRSEINF